MSASASNLSDPKYGYDVVVSTTQASVNSTMKFFLLGLPDPVATVCYVRGPDGTAQEIGYADLLKLSQGADPFKVSPKANPATDQSLAKLYKAGFLAGFRAQIGLPPMSDPAATPDIVAFGDSAASVTYNLLCAEFIVVQLDPSSWLSMSQREDDPWIFSAQVDLRLENVPGAKFAELPEAVRQQVKNLSGSAFGVQQLLFDLDNATLQTAPTFTGIPPGPLTKLLQTYFVGHYMKELSKTGSPLLACVVTEQPQSAATLQVSDMNLAVSPNADPDLSTLNYLCATANHKLPPAVPFTWSWVDPTEAGDCAGVVAVNRMPFIALLKEQLMPYVMANCYQPHVHVGLHVGQPTYDISVDPGGTPNVSDIPMTVKHPLLLESAFGARPPILAALLFVYTAKASDQAGLGGDIGKASMNVTYDAAVYFYANTIAVDQLLKIDMTIEKNLQATSGTPVNVRRVDTCTLDVDQFGQLIATMATPIKAVNNATESDTNSFVDFFLHVNEKFGSAAALVQRMTGATLTMLPFSAAQYFVFPGGQAFAYQKVAFATSGDLVSHISYADPDQVPPVLPLPAGRVIGTDHLTTGQWIANDTFLVSNNGSYAAYMQDDGNFVLCHATNGYPDLGRPYWSCAANLGGNFTGPGGAPCFALLQADGNLALGNGKSPLGAGLPYWTSKSTQDELGQFTAMLHGNGNFAIYHGLPDSLGDSIFATHTENAGR